MLETWSVDEKGTYLNAEKMTDHTLEEFHLDDGNYISVRIGIREKAEHKGGLNLFGDCFGDHPQDMVLKLIYK